MVDAIRERAGSAIRAAARAVREALAEGPVGQQFGRDEAESIASKIRERLEPEIRERIYAARAGSGLHSQRVKQATRERLRDAVQAAASRLAATRTMAIPIASAKDIQERLAEGLRNAFAM